MGYIHQPWTAPEQVLRSAGIILGETYPYPIGLDFRERSEDIYSRLENAYLEAPDDFLVHIPEHAAEEFRREAPRFAQSLQERIRRQTVPSSVAPVIRPCQLTNVSESRYE